MAIGQSTSVQTRKQPVVSVIQIGSASNGLKVASAVQKESSVTFGVQLHETHKLVEDSNQDQSWEKHLDIYLKIFQSTLKSNVDEWTLCHFSKSGWSHLYILE